MRPVAIIPIGYPKEKPRKESVVSFERLTWYDKYRQKYLVSMFFQPGASENQVFKPIGNLIKEKIEKYNKKEKK